MSDKKIIKKRIEMHKLYSHPLAMQFSKVRDELEKLSPSIQETNVLRMLNELGESVANEINSIIVKPSLEELEDIIDDFISDTNGEIESHFLAIKILDTSRDQPEVKLPNEDEIKTQSGYRPAFIGMMSEMDRDAFIEGANFVIDYIKKQKP